MDSTLLNNFRKDSSQNAAVLTRNDDRVRVDVEDNIDAEFWGDLLKELCPQNSILLQQIMKRRKRWMLSGY